MINISLDSLIEIVGWIKLKTFLRLDKSKLIFPLAKIIT